MLKSTFCHIPGIGPRHEDSMWRSGVFTWDDAVRGPDAPFRKAEGFRRHIMESAERLKGDDPLYFAQRLPASHLWRLYPEFRHSTAYLDIETNGLMGPYGYITTIALYDGSDIYYFVKGDNLRDFCDIISRYKVIVTYNGKCFDIPFIESHLGIRLRQAHIDLRYILRSLGFMGGLKGCEKGMGIDRGGLQGVDGYFAVLLWNDFKRRRDERTLETLLAYNIEDTVNLERLLIQAYNLKLRETPFEKSHSLRLPNRPPVPFTADRGTIERVRGENLRYFNSL